MLTHLNNIQQVPIDAKVVLCHAKQSAILNTCYDILYTKYSTTSSEWESYIVEYNNQQLNLDFSALSLFNDKRFIKLIILPNQLSENIVSLIEQALTTSSDILLLIKLYPQKKKFENTKWYKNLAQQETVLLADTKYKSDIIRFIEYRQKFLDLNLSYQQIDALVTLHNEDYYCIENSLNLIFYTQNTGNFADDQQLSINTVGQSFALIETLLKEDLNKTLNILNLLYKQGVEIQLLIWAIAYPIRQLYQLQIALQKGLAFTSACQNLNIWQNRIPFYKKLTARLNIEKLNTLIENLNQTDKINKGAKSGNAFQHLETTVLKFFVT